MKYFYFALLRCILFKIVSCKALVFRNLNEAKLYDKENWKTKLKDALNAEKIQLGDFFTFKRLKFSRLIFFGRTVTDNKSR